MGSPEQAKAYRIADNATAAIADWDQERLVQELLELQTMNVDLDSLGFSAEELDELIGSSFEPQCDPDDIPAPPDEPITQDCDLWILGDHRLLCADSSKSEDVERLLDGAAFNNPAKYAAFLDFNGDGVINTGDNLQFRNRFNKALRWSV